ncbi:MAG: hypothetical protein MZV70_25125 [Desulfobacterales bacterium]|nr:hypothetical protein [Desulfobacterales bacterium]
MDRAIADGNTDLEILVDNEVARENVSRLVNRRGLKADVQPERTGYYHSDGQVIKDRRLMESYQ